MSALKRLGPSSTVEPIGFEKFLAVFLDSDTLFPTTQVDHDREDRQLVTRPKQREVLEHPRVHVTFRPSLDFDVDQNELWLSLTGAEFGDHISFAPAAVAKVGEYLGVEEVDSPEIEPFLDTG